MENCPFCGHENLPGADVCDECHHGLWHIEDHRGEYTSELLEAELRALNPHSPVTIHPEEKIIKAIKIMQEHAFGCMIVCEEDKKIVGILSERDLMHKYALLDDKMSEKKVKDLMTKNPECLRAKDKIYLALNKMSVGGFRHIPITDNNIPIGIISIKDVLKFICQLS